ncbi:MAG: hypothetical protein JNM71_03995 [Flavobacterium lindanitolerans]|uniref:hypothetical protein n=1 Tax=Flavobacterium lindanitolerans TaxID=428988 RepID=UPI001A40553A|nr:hypothetical protein [Flavobacterium lindanitolerans]MBL7867161.1 hypothetical protein [Flavobacterium lindanitolerans]
MKKTKANFTQLDNVPDKETMSSLVDNLQYKRICTDFLPDEIKSNGLVTKFNSVIIAASGSTETMCYTIVGLRPDQGNTVIDEHPFVIGYNNNHPTQSFGGIIHHGDWNGRTQNLTQEQINILNTSGLTAEFTYKDIPMNTSGSLYDLHQKNMLEGISDQFITLLKRYNNE